MAQLKQVSLPDGATAVILRHADGRSRIDTVQPADAMHAKSGCRWMIETRGHGGSRDWDFRGGYCTERAEDALAKAATGSQMGGFRVEEIQVRGEWVAVPNLRPRRSQAARRRYERHF